MSLLQVGVMLGTQEGLMNPLCGYRVLVAGGVLFSS